MDSNQRHSYLSNNVKELVCVESCGLPERDEYDDLFLENGVLNWNAVKKIFNLNENFSKNGFSKYTSAVLCIYTVSHQVYSRICQLTSKEFDLRYKDHLSWTTKAKQLLECFSLLKSFKPGCLVLSLLLLTSSLERILGDIFLAYSDGMTACPSLLKDLLKTQELRSVLGECFMSCLDVFIGSPCGLNLRNLAWHGFFSEDELPAHYVSFLLMLTISLAETMKIQSNPNNIKPQCFESLLERPLIKYLEVDAIKDIFADLETVNLCQVFSMSNFVTASMLHLWHLALHFFQNQRYEYAAMIMLPQLEHSLRRLYASANDMPERVQTAESAEFYTTFNEILSPVLADGARNKLVDSLESCYIELLLDVLVHPEGPRLRDHLSHGEVDVHHFPKHLANHILCIAVAFCLREDASGVVAKDGVERKCSTSKIGTLSETDSYLEILDTAKNYRSIFHPFSCLRRELLTLIGSLLNWTNLIRPSDDEFRETYNDDLCDETTWKRIINSILRQTSLQNFRSWVDDEYSSPRKGSICDEAVLKKMLSLIDDCQLDTLFRPRYELEVVVLLRQVVGQCVRTSDQIQQTSKARYSEWEAKTLRSRQRNNYKRFWSHLPSLCQTLCLLTVVIISEFLNINKFTGVDVKKNKFLKKCLQCSENLASLSSVSRNRWLECSECSKTWLLQLQKEINQ